MLFRSDAQGRGYPDVGGDAAEIKRVGFAAFRESLGILKTCVIQNPDVGSHKRKKGIDPA